MVEIGAMLLMMDAGPVPNRRMPSATRKLGSTVAIIAMPNAYS